MRWYAACREACTCRVGGSALPSRAGAGLTLSDVPASSRTPARTRFRPTSMLAGRPAPLSFPSAPPAEFALTACRVDGRHAWPVSPQAGAVFRAVSTTPRTACTSHRVAQRRCCGWSGPRRQCTVLWGSHGALLCFHERRSARGVPRPPQALFGVCMQGRGMRSRGPRAPRAPPEPQTPTQPKPQRPSTSSPRLPSVQAWSAPPRR